MNQSVLITCWSLKGILVNSFREKYVKKAIIVNQSQGATTNSKQVIQQTNCLETCWSAQLIICKYLNQQKQHSIKVALSASIQEIHTHQSSLHSRITFRRQMKLRAPHASSWSSLLNDHYDDPRTISILPTKLDSTSVISTRCTKRVSFIILTEWLTDHPPFISRALHEPPAPCPVNGYGQATRTTPSETESSCVAQLRPIEPQSCGGGVGGITSVAFVLDLGFFFFATASWSSDFGNRQPRAA